MEAPRYPIGIQSFEKLRELNAVYVDKTALIYQLTQEASCVFLSRPRRFGKSLLASTLHSYFAGRRDLFGGLAIERLESDWIEYPVLHFDLSTVKNKSVGEMRETLLLQFDDLENLYGSGGEKSPGDRLAGLIKRAYAKTGRKVVVLIDEYDAPILDLLHTTVIDDARRMLQEFFMPLKACDQYIRFVFITGITKFSQLSIFSTLNNLTNISMMDRYSSICGITEQEMLDNFQYGIAELAKKKRCSSENIVSKLKNYYDGYHFSGNCKDIYNPFSLLNAFYEGEIKSFWFGSATPTFLVETLRKYKEEGLFNLNMLDETAAVTVRSFDVPTEAMTGPLPLLFQSGYLTIKSYDDNFESYVLGVPNEEVRMGLLYSLLPLYSSMNVDSADSASLNASIYLQQGDYNSALQLLKSLLASVPYMRGDKDILADKAKTEAHYHILFYFFFKMLHRGVTAEVRSAQGASDVVVFTDRYIYVIEIKIDSTPEAALQQIQERGYAEPYKADGKEIIAIGVNFSSKSRTIEAWKRN
jgi:hypothetical protein